MSVVLSEALEMPAFMSYLTVRGSYAKVGSAEPLTQKTIGPIPSISMTGNPMVMDLSTKHRTTDLTFQILLCTALL
jgi:hypothetical protein